MKPSKFEVLRKEAGIDAWETEMEVGDSGVDLEEGGIHVFFKNIFRILIKRDFN